MSPTQFWTRIGTVHRDSDLLSKQLRSLSRSERVAFSREWSRQLASLRSARLWWQAYLASSGFECFSFAQFIAWIVLQGEAFHAAALLPPKKSFDLPMESPALVKAIEPESIARVSDPLEVFESTPSRRQDGQFNESHRIPSSVAKREGKLVFDAIMSTPFVGKTYPATIARFWPPAKGSAEGLKLKNLATAVALAESGFVTGHLYAARFWIGAGDSKQAKGEALQHYLVAAQAGLVEAQAETVM